MDPSEEQKHHGAAVKVSRLTLQKWFAAFNKHYYKGRMYRWHVEVARRDIQGIPDALGSCNHRFKQILISPNVLHDKQRAIDVVLHEMAPIRERKHNGLFMSDLLRLRKLGAPVSDRESLEASAYCMFENAVNLCIPKDLAKEMGADYYDYLIKEGLTPDDLIDPARF